MGDIWKTHGTFAIFLLEKLEKGADQGLKPRKSQ
jgi:hypothetical protein